MMMMMMMLYNTRDMVRNVNQILLSKDKLVLLPFIIIIVIIIYKTDKKKMTMMIVKCQKIIKFSPPTPKKIRYDFYISLKRKINQSIRLQHMCVCVCVTKFMIFCNYKKILFTYEKKNPPATRCHN